MNYPICAFATDRTRKFAQDLKASSKFNFKSDKALLTLATGLVSVYKNENGAEAFPTVSWVEKKKQENDKFLKEVMLAIPVYKAENAGTNAPYMRFDDNGNIFLNTMTPESGKESNTDKQEYVSRFKEHIRQHAQEIGYQITDRQLELLTSKNIVYRFLLYSAKSLMVNTPQNATQEQRNEAERTAIDEAFSSISSYKKTDEYKNSEGNVNKMNETIDAINEFITFLGQHVKFDEKTHTYFFDGRPQDYLASSYARIWRQEADPFNGETHWSRLGTDYDQIWRDYFDGKLKSEYKNFTKAQLDAIIQDIKKFEALLKARFGKYKVIANMPGMYGYGNFQDGVKKTFAGTPDLMVVDGNGFIHFFDMKAKTETQTINTGHNYEDYVTQQNIYRLLVEMFPKLKNKVKSLNLIWGKTRYPANNSYSIEDDGTINVVQNAATKTALKYMVGFRQPLCDTRMHYDVLGNATEVLDTISIDITNEVKVRYGKNVQIPTIHMMPTTQQGQKENNTGFSWARTSDNSYELSTRGDKRFSALNAHFAQGTVIFGHDVSGRTIESVYQHGIKQNDWNTATNDKTGAPRSGMLVTWQDYFRNGQSIKEVFPALPQVLIDKMQDSLTRRITLTKDDLEDISFYMGYLPLWQEWVKQNPELLKDLRQKAAGKTLTDQFASSRVSQARALAYIMNAEQAQQPATQTGSLGELAGETDIAEIVNPDGSINFEKLEEVTDKYFNNADEALFKKGRKTLRTREEHHQNENNTLEHLQNVVKSAMEMQLDDRLKSELVLAAALHDIAKPFHGGQMHGFQSAELINKLFKGNVSKLVRFAVRHHMLTLVDDGEFTQEDATRIVQDAIDNGIRPDDAIVLLMALNTADILSGQPLDAIDQITNKTKQEVIQDEISQKTIMLMNAMEGILNNQGNGTQGQQYQSTLNNDIIPQIPQRVVTATSNWSRDAAFKDAGSLYVFGDNADRSSGRQPLFSDSWYQMKYGNGKQLYYPTRNTTAVIRGLENAYPITTVKTYIEGNKDYDKIRYFDKDIEEFRKQIKQDIDQIIEAYDTGKYSRIVFPANGMFGSNISQITRDRCPEIFEALREELMRLYKHVYIKEFEGKAQTDEQKAELDRFAERYAESMLPRSIHSKVNVTEKVEAPSHLPTIGQGMIAPNVNDQMTQLHMQMSPQEISLRVSNITRFFERELVRLSNEKIAEKRRLIDESNSPEEQARLEAEIKRLQPDNNENWQRETINECGMENILNAVRDKFVDLSNSKSTQAQQSARKVLANFSALMSMSVSSISSRLGITLFFDYVNRGTPLAHVVSDARQQGSVDEEGDTADETNKTAGNESYLYKAKYQNTHLTINKRVKRLLSDIYQGEYDEDSEEYEGFVDEFGENLYIPEKVTYTTLKNALKGLRDSDDFAVRVLDEEDQDEDIGTREIVYEFPALEKIKYQHPWVRLVISKLESEPDLVPLFYAAMREEVTWYDIQIPSQKLGYITPVHVNQSVTSEVVLKTAENLYNAHIITNDNCIWKINGERDVQHAARVWAQADHLLQNISQFAREQIDDYFQQASYALQSVGIEVNAETLAVLYQNDYQKFEKVLQGIKSIAGLVQSDKEYNEAKSIIDNASGFYTDIATQLIDYIQIDIPATHRQGDKSLPNFSVPDALDILVKNLASDDYAHFIEKQFGFDQWYFQDGKYRGYWMKDLADENNSLLRQMLKITNLYQVRGSYSNIEYQKWRTFDIDVNFMVRFFSDYARKKDGNRYVEVPVPILSDSETALFIRFKQYGYIENGGSVSDETKGGEIISGLVEVALQELYRMNLVDARENNKEISKIAYFDTTVNKKGEKEGRGRKFCFLPYLNDNIEEYKQLYNSGNISELKQRLRNVIYDNCVQECAEFEAQLTKDKSFDAVKQNLEKMGVVNQDFDMSAAIRMFYMNFMFAQANIVQLTVKDYAFYKDLVDFQKRFKQIYASGKRLFTNSRYGRKIERAIYVQDYIGTSRSWKAFEKVLNMALEQGHLGDKNNVGKMNRDNILRSLKNINSTDAQALRTLESYRAVMDMAGRWSRQQDEALQRIINDEYDMSDINMIWQTIKPFMFTSTQKDDGVGGKMKVYHQNKNSEFLLLAAYQMIENSLQKSGMMRGLNKWMLNNKIDVIHFESAVKTGNQGIVTITAEPENVEKACRKINKEYEDAHPNSKSLPFSDNEMTFDNLKRYLDNRLSEDTITQDEYNDIIESVMPNETQIQRMLDRQVFKKNEDGSIMTDAEGNNVFNPNVLHEFSYEDYIIQQETPEHIIDAETIVGSQFRMLLPADLPQDFSIKLKSNGRVHELNREKVINYFRRCLSENVIESYMKVRDDFQNIDKLSESLIRQVQDNPKYDSDMVEALRVIEVQDPFDSSKTIKVFNIPFDNPTTINKIEELLLSKFKNRVTKQYIRGGNAILVSSIGYTNELKVEYYEEDVYENGELLHAKGSMKGYQAYLPATSRKFFEPLMQKNKDGVFYLDITKLDDDLREALGYRIPTEDKYSMIPIIIKGFLPENNGSAIMLPMEIVKFGGMDFDVDKEFLIFPEFEVIKHYDNERMFETFLDEYPSLEREIRENKYEAFQRNKEKWLEKNADYKNLSETQQYVQWMSEHSRKDLSWATNPQEAKETYKNWKKHNRDRFITVTEVKKVQYDLDQVEREGVKSLTRAQRNNLFLDIAREVLKSNKIAHLTTASNNFDEVELYAHMFNTLNVSDAFEQYRNDLAEKLGVPVNELTVEQIMQDVRQHIDANDMDYFNKYTKRYMSKVNPLSFSTWKILHQSNMAGAALIGMYANQNTGHAKFQGSSLGINPAYSIRIDNRKNTSLHEINNEDGIRILSKTTQMSAASVDNGKKQVLDKVMQTTNTANITSYMLRLGYSMEQTLAFLGQPAIRDFISRGNFTDKAFKEYHRDLIDTLKYNGIDPSSLPSARSESTYEFTSNSLLQNIIQENLYKATGSQRSREYMISQYKAFCAFRYRVYAASKELSDFVQQTRGDSPNGALSPFLNEALAQRYAYKALIVKSKQTGYPLVGLQDILETPDNVDPDDAQSIREAIEKCPNLLWKAFQLCGKDFAYDLIKDYVNILHRNSLRILDYIMGTQYSLSPYNTKVLIRNYIKSFTSYVLSGTQLFGDEENGLTYQEKMYYYRAKFPREFVEMVKNNKALSSNPLLSKAIVRYDGTLGIDGSARMEKEERERYKYAMDELLYMTKKYKEDGSVDPDTVITATIDGQKREITGQEIAVHLMRYSYYAEQLYFTPSSVGVFFSTTFLNSFPEYINTLRRIKGEMDRNQLLSTHERPDGFNGFLVQYFYNNMFILAPQVYPDNENGKPHTVNDELKGYLFQLGKVTMYNQFGNESNTLFPYIKMLHIDEKGNQEFHFYRLNNAYHNSQYAEYTEIDYKPMVFFYKRGSDITQTLDAFDQYMEMFPKTAQQSAPQSTLAQTADNSNTSGNQMLQALDAIQLQQIDEYLAMEEDYHDSGSDNPQAQTLQPTTSDEQQLQEGWQSLVNDLEEMKSYVAQGQQVSSGGDNLGNLDDIIGGMNMLKSNNNAPQVTPSKEAEDTLGKKC